jgi:hypothetical protein
MRGRRELSLKIALLVVVKELALAFSGSNRQLHIR